MTFEVSNKHIMRLFYALLLGLLLANTTHSQSSIDSEKLTDSIQSILKKEHIPGVFVTVVSKDSILYKRGIGLADVAQQIPVNTSHLFQIGSISKTFTALAVMKLIEEGKLRLNTKLADIAPEVPFENEWEATHPVRIKHLLNHQAGFDDTHMNVFVLPRTKDMTALDEVMLMKASLTSRWKPGFGHAYSNTGCTILGHIIEKITSRRYQEYIKNEVLLPLHMNSTDFRSVFNDTLSSDNFSLGYEFVDERMQQNGDMKIICEPAGALLSNADDMSHFLQFLLNRKTADNHYVVSPTTIETMEALHGDLEIKHTITDGYGLAIYTKPYGSKNIRFYGHAGDIQGFSSLYIYNRELDLGIALSRNTLGSTKKLIKLLVNVFASDINKANQEENIDGSTLLDWEGTYRKVTTRNQKFNFIEFPIKTVSLKVVENNVELGKFLNNKKEVYVNQKGTSFTKRKHFAPSLVLLEQDGKKYIRYKYDMYAPVNKTGLLIFRILFALSVGIGVIAILIILIQSIITLFKKSWRTNNLKNSIIIILPLLCIFLSIISISYFVITGSDILGTFNLFTVFIYVLTTLFPFAIILAIYWLVKNWHHISNQFLKIYFSLVIFSGIFLTVYFMYHGWFMKMLWV